MVEGIKKWWYQVFLPPCWQHASKEEAVGGSKTSAGLYVARQAWTCGQVDMWTGGHCGQVGMQIGVTMRTAVGSILATGGVFVGAATHTLDFRRFLW